MFGYLTIVDSYKKIDNKIIVFNKLNEKLYLFSRINKYDKTNGLYKNDDIKVISNLLNIEIYNTTINTENVAWLSIDINEYKLLNCIIDKNKHKLIVIEIDKNNYYNELNLIE